MKMGYEDDKCIRSDQESNSGPPSLEISMLLHYLASQFTIIVLYCISFGITFFKQVVSNSTAIP